MTKTIRETPDFVINKFLDKVYLGMPFDGTKYKYLEPSAGFGKIALKLLENFNVIDKNLDLTCIELNSELCEIMKEHNLNVIHKDFLSYNTDYSKKYDIIIAAPPFKNNIDLKHIMHMYNMLNSRGIIVCLTSPYWLTNNEPLQVEFRSFIQDKKYSLELLPDNTFKEKDKTVPTAILELKK